MPKDGRNYGPRLMQSFLEHGKSMIEAVEHLLVKYEDRWDPHRKTLVKVNAWNHVLLQFVSRHRIWWLVRCFNFQHLLFNEEVA